MNELTIPKEALFYAHTDNQQVVCALCPHRCQLADGQTGRCRARRNQAGTLIADSYGKVTAMALDPIEKKPLRRFYPGSLILSVGSFGCNFRCPFCQNYRIAQQTPAFDRFAPAELATYALSLVPQGNIGLAYTYNEPLVGYEFVLDCAQRIRAQGQKNVLVSNGFICPEPWEYLLPWIDAINIDLKAIRPDFYRTLGGQLADVQRTIARAAAQCHVEVTCLVIPGEQDSPAEMETLARWLAAVDRDIPLHVSRFSPAYQYADRPAAPRDTVHALADIAQRHLSYVYTGNC